MQQMYHILSWEALEVDDRLIMNRELGTKWFTFYTKFRPWLAVIAALTSTVSFVQYPDAYLYNIALLIAFLGTLAQAVLSITVAVKAKGDYRKFVSFVKPVLAFETINLAYQTSVEQYYQNDYDIAVAAIFGLVALLLGYFVWYRLNVKYFSRRLRQAPRITQIADGDTEPVYSEPSEQASAQDREMTKEGATIGLAGDGLSSSPNNVRCCSYCGSALDPVTKICTACGKPHFILTQKAAIVVLEVLFLVSVVTNIILFISNTQLQSDIVTMEIESAAAEEAKDTYYSFYESNCDLVELIDSDVVFIEDDGTQLYHKYRCDKFLEEAFYVHNVQYAEYLEYKPCPDCFG